MVGIVIVSHSQKLAEGVMEVAQMSAANVPIVAAGGLANGAFGTSYDKIKNAVESIYTDDGVIVLADMGSAVMTAEMVLEDIDSDNVKLIDCPLVEGAVFAAVESVGERTLTEIIEKLRSCLHSRKAVY